MAKKIKKFKEMDLADLQKTLATLRDDMHKIRFTIEGSKSKNVKEIGNLKREIARVLTEINKNIKKN